MIADDSSPPHAGVNECSGDFSPLETDRWPHGITSGWPATGELIPGANRIEMPSGDRLRAGPRLSEMVGNRSVSVPHSLTGRGLVRKMKRTRRLRFSPHDRPNH